VTQVTYVPDVRQRARSPNSTTRNCRFENYDITPEAGQDRAASPQV